MEGWLFAGLLGMGASSIWNQQNVAAFTFRVPAARMLQPMLHDAYDACCIAMTARCS